MGAYLSEPNLKKESIDDDLGQLSYGASSMQGWRLEQEDAHNAILNFDSETNTSFFAVYDGHGGAEVAQYCAKYLPAYLKTLDEYKKGELVDALKALFLKFDESLLSEKAEKELRELQEGSVHEDETSENGNNNNKKDSDEDDEEEEEETDSETDKENNKKKPAKKEYVNEADALCDEACMPLEEVLKRYSNTEKKVKKALKKNANTTTHTMSPAINAAGSSRKKSKLANQNNNNEAEVPKSANDFNQQEELDITEIKKNGNLDEETNGTNQQNENDFDEASNLCDLTDSQKSINGSDTANNTLNKTDLNKSTVAAAVSSASNTTDVTNNNNELTIPKTPKPKMTKEELKLSPIRKKSLSSSSLTEDALSSTTTENNMNGSCSIATNNDENKENNDAEPTAAVVSSTESVVAVESTASTIEPVENVETNNKKAGLRQVTRKDLIAKLLAGCIKEKLKQSTKQKSKQKKAELIDNVDDEEEEDEDYQVPKSLDEDEDLGEDDDDDDDDESDEDFESDEDDDDDEEVDDEEDEEEEDEEEEEEEETDYSTQQGGNRPGYDSGCTAVVALLRENKHLYVANAGDSRCVVCRDGKAIEMSFDHKPEDDLERERVEKAGGHVTKDGRINNGLNLSRAIGDHSYKANKELPLSEQMITSLPDVKVLDIDLSKDLFMVLACDGIWNFMSSQDVCDFIQERLNANYSKLSQICEELFMHCLAPNSEGDGTGCDNMTCILVTFNPFRKVEFKLNRLVDNNIEKQSLKRSLENGTANIEEIEKNNNTGLNQSPSTLAKKLKQDQQESKHLV